MKYSKVIRLATNPLASEPGSIRGQYAVSIGELKLSKNTRFLCF